jgi:hypothetical protein
MGTRQRDERKKMENPKSDELNVYKWGHVELLRKAN